MSKKTDRRVLDDGRWFDREAADAWDEGTRWNGNNHISLATGTQFDHERLYRTAGGRWILNHWSQWQGSGESWEEISDDDAARWLVKNEHGRAAEEYFPAEHAALEVG